MERYRYSPTKYLETRLKTLPDAIKWYFQALSIVVFTGLFGTVSLLIKISYDNFVSSALITKQIFNLSHDIKWIFPSIVILLIYYSRINILRWIQRTFRIRMNFNEIDIEIFYITKILEVRDNKEKD